jgi:serine protease Do
MLALVVLLFLGLACASQAKPPEAPQSAAPADWPGIAVAAIPGDLRSALKVNGGVYVEAVYPGGAADTAGVLQGDIIIAVNDTPVSDVASFQAALQGVKAGEAVFTLYGGEKSGRFRR